MEDLAKRAQQIINEIRTAPIKSISEVQNTDDDVILAINRVIADLTVFAENCRTYHWIVTGANFFDLHECFGDLYDTAADQIDAFAERTRQLQRVPMTKLSELLKLSGIKEVDITDDDILMVRTIVDNMQTLISSLSSLISAATKTSDRPTIFMVDQIVGGYEKKQWFLNAFVAKNGK